MFYILFFEKFERIEMTRKVFYIVFHEVLERNQTYRKMFYTNFFLHIKISPTSKTVLSFIPSGIITVENSELNLKWAKFVRKTPDQGSDRPDSGRTQAI